MATNTLRPGLLVSLKTQIKGGVDYRQKTIEAAHNTGGGSEKAVWETERTITDPVEYEAAKIARGKARSIVTAVCSQSAFGLLCPEVNAGVLEAAIADARKVVDAFNATAGLSRVSVYVITGKVASDDVEAVKAINSEVRDLLDTMASGVNNLDVKVIRDAAAKAKSLGSMLSPDAEARIQIAIDTARTAARKMVKAGEQAAQEIDRAAVRKIAEQRTAFLDLDEGKAIAKPTSEARALDLDVKNASDAYVRKAKRERANAL